MKNTSEPTPAPAVPAAVAVPIAAELVSPGPGQMGRARSEVGDRFAVVALCGSAGALEAIEQFFAHLPPSAG